VERLIFHAILMTSGHSSKRRPRLTFVSYKLPFIFANWTGGWRLRAFIELRPTLHTDEILHRGYELNLLT
jgi:hypothetical protein